MTWLYGTKHAGYNWQPNHYADYAQPQGAPYLLLMLITSFPSTGVELNWTRITCAVCAVVVIQKSLHGS